MVIKRLKGTAWIAYEDGRGVLIDAGLKAQSKLMKRKLDKLDIDLQYILMTHTHYDHTGATEQIRAATGAKVVVGAAEAECLKCGHTDVPRGTNAFWRMIGNAGHDVDPKHIEHYTPVKGDVVLIEAHTSLEIGSELIEAIPLGAHSVGSVGYRIDEHIFVGDVVFGIAHVVYPWFADFEEDIEAAWGAIIESGAKYIYPGHGRRLSVEYLRRKRDERYKSNSKKESKNV
ncbi:MAG: MBL fold metallo-hydrolase [Clostridia bacterium]|nr:MBL fold metallo-hydrolase [Clostridia bacterium]MBT7123210.1 MBL fold metallo-hydrolase [Clostridia bacterium]